MDRRTFLRGAVATGIAPLGLVLGIKTAGAQPRTASPCYQTWTGRVWHNGRFHALKLHPYQAEALQDFAKIEKRVMAHFMLPSETRKRNS